MRYVMVPVPTEHVLDVMRWVLFRAPEDGDVATRDSARVTKLVSEADELTRSILLLVAAAAVRDEPLRLSDIADELDHDPQVVRTAVRDVNQHALGAGRNLLTVRSETAVGVHGNTGKIAYIAMRPDLARMVRAAAKATPAGGG